MSTAQMRTYRHWWYAGPYSFAPEVAHNNYSGELTKGDQGVIFTSHHTRDHTRRILQVAGTYGAFTVSKDAVPRVKGYIEHQKEHHASDQLLPHWEVAEVVDKQ
jgi:hypothetical protein